MNKRKRDEFSDSDPDEIAPGKQILPVANLPHNFDQEPQDGMQYLFLVRRDARRLPHVTRVRNPYEVSETEAVPIFTPLPTNILPCEEWRAAFQTHFSNLRKNLAWATAHIDLHHSDSRRQTIPEKKDRDAWWKFLTGYPESTWSPRGQSARKKPNTSCRMRTLADPSGVVRLGDATSLPDVQSRDKPFRIPITCLDDMSRNTPRHQSSSDVLQITGSTDAVPFDLPTSPQEAGEEHEHLSPPEITPSHLREIDHRMSIHLLMYFTHWINAHLQNPDDALSTILVSHGRWIFALLAKIDDQLSADEMNLLRNLARACLGFIQRYGNAAQGVSSPTLKQDTMRMSDVSCWMIFAAIAGYWGQRDLWADAGATLASA